MAWREIRPALKKFLFMIAAIALGVGAVSGIKGFSQALDLAMSRSARDLIAADLSVRFNSAPQGDDLKLLESLQQRGAVLTRVTETLSMASSDAASRPLLSTIKAVDPRYYPFYGKVETAPGAPLRSLLTDDAAIATQELLTRTGTSLGETIRIGSGKFRLAAVLISEPDRLASGIELGPRILITRNALEKSGLIQFGSRATEYYLYKIPQDGDLDAFRAPLTDRLGRTARISDYRTPNPSVSRGLERMANFLSLVGLLSLLVGGLGVATTVHTYLQQKLDSIAIIKSMGGRSFQIIRIYLIQGLCLGVAGSLAGVGLGYLVQVLFPLFLRGLIDLPTELELAPSASVQAFVIGVATTLLFLLPPLLAIRKVRPARVFLREMPETHYSTFQRLRHDPLPLASALLLLLGVGMVASWLADSWERGFAFIGGLAGAVLILALVARLLMSGLKRLPRPSSLTLRHGIKNLYRPGSHVASILVAMGIGVAFVLTIYQIQTSLLSQIVQSAPANFPNFFILGVTDNNRDDVWKFLKSQRGIVDPGSPIPAVPSRLQLVDGKTDEELDLDERDRRFFRIEFILTWAQDVPPDTRILSGTWWKPLYERNLISVGERAARNLKLQVGSTMQFESSGRIVKGTVANIRDVEFSRPGSSNQFIFSPGSLDGLPSSYVGAVRVAPASTGSLQGALFRRFPGITSVDVGQVILRVQVILDRIAAVIRFIAFFAILSGVIILASSVASTRYQRIREAVLLKTLGATRKQVARIQAAEFLIVGTVAGLIGGLLAAAAADYILGELLDTEFEFRWIPLLVGTVCTAALAIATGWIASRGVLNHRPLEILREN
jgi:putative ABC transport system permease protein